MLALYNLIISFRGRGGIKPVCLWPCNKVQASDHFKLVNLEIRRTWKRRREIIVSILFNLAQEYIQRLGILNKKKEGILKKGERKGNE